MKIINSLVARFFMATILFFFLYAIVITILVNGSQKEYCHENFSLKSEIYADLIESELTKANSKTPSNLNPEDFNFFKADTHLLYVHVLDQSGNTISKLLEIDNIRDTTVDNFLLISESINDKVLIRNLDDVIEVITPLALTAEEIGYVNFGYSKQKLNEDVEEFRNMLLYSSVAILFIGIVLAFISLRIQSKPIKEYIAKIKLIAGGNLDQKVEISHYTELKQLSISFNEMTEILNETRHSLIHEKERAEQSSKLKTEFLAQMSHEIRSPINTILSFTSLMREDLEESLPEEYEDYFSSINNAGSRITRTIDMILDLSEIQTGTYETKFMVFDIHEEVLKFMVSEYQSPAKKKGLSIKLENNAEDTMLHADQYMISQVFQNLIDNAIKYSREGTICVKISDMPDKKLKIEVADNGIGISEEFIGNLFDPFRQEEQGYSRHFEGSGLGLALVKKYCELNDAEISVKSIKGEGSTFTVIFNKYIPDTNLTA